MHVVHKTAAQNISDAQIKSQIDVLTADFRKKNADVSTVPAPFAPLAADARIEFELAKTDPSGNPTNGITRTATTVNRLHRRRRGEVGGDAAAPMPGRPTST